MSGRSAGEGRLLVFEIGGSAYSLPIDRIVEVAEERHAACIPTLPPRIGRVINWHGAALPVVGRSALLDLDENALPEPEHVLVVSDRPGRIARLGLEVDRVLGFVEGAPAVARGSGPVAETRPIDGRVTRVLDAQRMLARAREVIERSLGRSDGIQGG